MHDGAACTPALINRSPGKVKQPKYESSVEGSTSRLPVSIRLRFLEIHLAATIKISREKTSERCVLPATLHGTPENRRQLAKFRFSAGKTAAKQGRKRGRRHALPFGRFGDVRAYLAEESERISHGAAGTARRRGIGVKDRQKGARIEGWKGRELSRMAHPRTKDP